MPQFNLTTATPEELRQLLAATRRRGDAALSYQILQEMAARRETAAPRRGLLRSRRPAEPRHINVDLGDPLEPTGEEIPPMPNWRPPRGERPRLSLDEAVADLDAAHAPIDAAEEEPQLHLERAPPEPPRPRRRIGGFPVLVAGLGLGIPLGMAFGWWVATTPQAHTPAPAAPPTQMAALETQPAAPAPTALIPAPPETPAPAATAAEASPETPPAAEPDPKLVAELAPPPAPEPAREAEPTPAATASTGECAGQPTPADREICATPRLRRLQEELRRAYAEALAAHQDRALLRSRQLAWRDQRNGVADPDRLASLYSERIRRLNAATEAARSQR